MRVRSVPVVLAILCLTNPRVASADGVPDGAVETSTVSDAAIGDEASPSQGGSSGNAAPSSGTEGGTTYVMACDGALCDTTTGSQCGVSARAPGSAQESPKPWFTVSSAFALLAARRASRRASRPSRSPIVR